MIPKKIPFWRKKRLAKFMESLPPLGPEERYRLSEIAERNSIRKYGNETQNRFHAAIELKSSRLGDRLGSWGISFNASLHKVNSFTGINLEKEIKRLFPNGGNVMEIGCGSGRTVSELRRVLNKKFSLTATGLTAVEAWTKHRNYKKIDWRVMSTEKPLKNIKPNSVDFIYSNFGPFNQPTPVESIAFARKVLRPGGRLLFTTESKLSETPKGFKFISSNSTRLTVKHKEYGNIETIVFSYYLEKL